MPAEIPLEPYTRLCLAGFSSPYHYKSQKNKKNGEGKHLGISSLSGKCLISLSLVIRLALFYSNSFALLSSFYGNSARTIYKALPCGVLIPYHYKSKTNKKNGEGGIRTRGKVAPAQIFEICTLNRSDTSPTYFYSHTKKVY